MLYRKSSGSLRSEQLFLRPAFAAASITGLRLRAKWGQTATQRMQVMHLSVSVFVGSEAGMAPTGHSAAHLPHLPHFIRLAAGCSGTPSYFRNTRLPGTMAVGRLPVEAA